MASLLLLATSLLALSQEKAVTLDTGAMRVPLVLEKLSTEAGIPIKATPAFQDEILFLTVKNRSVDDVMNRIAEVCHAEWEKKQDATYLVRSQKRVVADRKAETEFAASAFRKSFEATTKGDSEPWTEQNVAARLDGFRKGDLTSRTSTNRMTYSLPMGKLFRRIVGSLDFNALTQYPNEELIAFSTQPNKMQLPLAGDSAKALAEFASEHQALWSYLSTAVDKNSGDRFEQMVRYSAGSYRASLNMPVVAYLRVLRTGEDRLHFMLKVYDRDGYEVAWTQMPFMTNPQRPEVPDLPGIREWGPKPIPISEAAKAVFNAFSGRVPLESPIPGADRPDLNEPLGRLLDGPLRDLAKDTNLDLVARIPDIIVRSAVGLGREGATKRSVVDTLLTDCTMKVDKDVLVIEPIFSEGTFNTRSKRSVLAKLIAAASDPVPTLADAMEYARLQRDAVSNTFESMSFTLNGLTSDSFEPLRLVYGVRREERVKMKAFGSLTSLQRQAMANGGLRFGDLTAPQRDLWSLYIYRVSGRLHTEIPEASPVRGSRNALSEPSLAYPNGIPSDALLTLEVKNEPGVYLRKSATQRKLMGMDLFASGAADLAAGDKSNPELNQEIIDASCSEAVVANLLILLSHGNNLLTQFNLADNEVTGPAKSSWKSLPEDYAKRIESRIGSYRRARGGG